MPAPAKNRLVNRSTGLYSGGPTQKKGDSKALTPNVASIKAAMPVSINKIAAGLDSLIVDIDVLLFDPDNARRHPDGNLEAIRQSLQLYGQVKPVVVRKATNVVVAGNGTLEAAKQLGWTKLAASFVDMTEIEAIGYGLADNRTAELAKWDFETVARLDKLLQEANHSTIGWTVDELEVLRAAEWTPPTVDSGAGTGSEGEPESLLISFTPDQYVVIGKAIAKVRASQVEGTTILSQDSCLETICTSWLENQ